VGALIFYTGIYFLGYYAVHLLNQGASRALVSNRRIAGLVLVLAVGVAHAYKIISTPPPHDHGDGANYALGFYVILPVIIIAIAVFFFNRQDSQDRQEDNDQS
jgi:hypothetical protein